MIGYVFVNSKMSGINAGIQALHGMVELSQQSDTVDYDQWAQGFKTVVLLNGGSHQNLELLADEIANYCVPVGVFREVDVNDAITAVAVVANAEIMECIEDIKWCRKAKHERDAAETFNRFGPIYGLAELLQSYPTLRG